MFSVLTYGADPTGAVDSTAAFNAAIAAAVAANVSIPGTSKIYVQSNTVYVPAGTYLVSSTIVVNAPVAFRGDGHSQSLIFRTADYGDTFYFVPSDPVNGTEIEGVAVQDLGFYATHPAPTKGAHLHFEVCSEAVVSNVDVKDQYGGILLTGCSNFSMSNVRMESGYFAWAGKVPGSYFVQLAASGSKVFNPMCSTVQVTNLNAQSQYYCDFGVVINNCDLASFNGGYVGGCASADVVIAPTAATDGIWNITFAQIGFDVVPEPGAYGEVITNAAGGSIQNITHLGCYFGNGTIGVYVDAPGAMGITYSACRFFNNKAEALIVEAGTSVRSIGCLYDDNSLGTPGPQIVLGGGTDVRFVGDSVTSSSASATIGIDFTAPVTDAAVIGVEFKGILAAMAGQQANAPNGQFAANTVSS